MVLVSDLLVLFADEFPFRVLWIKCGFPFARDLETKERALAFALALTAALHLVVIISRIENVHIVQTAAAHCAQLITNGVFHTIER